MAVQQHWQFGWDCTGSGLRISETDPNNAVTTVGYDARGRQASFNQANLRATATTYNDAAQTALTKRDLNSLADGVVQTTKYVDDIGRVWKTQSTDGSCGGGIQSISLQQVSGGFTYQLVSNPFC